MQNVPVDLKKVTNYDYFKKRLSKCSKYLGEISFYKFLFEQKDKNVYYF